MNTVSASDAAPIYCQQLLLHTCSITFQRYLQTCSTLASKSVPLFTSWLRPRASPILVNHGLLAHLLTRSTRTSKFTPFQPPSVAPTCTIAVSMSISELTPLWPPSTSPSTLIHGVHGYNIMATKFVSKFTQLWTVKEFLRWHNYCLPEPHRASSISLGYGLHVHL